MTGALLTAPHPIGYLAQRQVAQSAEQVVHRVGRARLSITGECLELELELGQRPRIEQLAQLLGTQQLAQQVAIERQRLCPAVDERRVALVHV